MSARTHATICWVLAYAMLVSPLMVYAQEAGQRAQQGQTEPLLRYVPAEAAFAAIARPRAVLTHPSMQMLPIEVLSAAGKQELGLDPLDIETALIVAAPPLAGPPEMGLVLKMTDKSATLTMRQPPPFVRAMDGIIVVASSPEFGEKLIASQQSELAPLAATLDRAAKLNLAATLDVAKLRPLAQMAFAQAPPLPPPFEPLKQTPQLVSRVDLGIRTTDNPAAALSLVANSAADAETLEKLLGDALEAGRAMLVAQLEAEMAGDDPIEVASKQYAMRIMNMSLEAIKPKRSGDKLTFSATAGESGQVATVSILVMLLLPAVNAAREAARRAQAINQVKQLSLAMINYEATRAMYPARASFDAQGKPLLSWRVHILPYLEEGELYKQFRLDEPWDSEHNRKLIDQMPSVYANPNLGEPGKTNFLVAVGPGTVFEGTEGLKVRRIKDGTSKTFLIFEADPDRAVTWTKPDDLKYDPANPLAGLGHLRFGGFVASRCDGSVSFYSNDTDWSVLNALFTFDGGEPVDQ